MIAWIYSDPEGPGFDRGVRTSYQNFLEGTKTVVDASNHFRDVSNVVRDDFMVFGDSLGVKQVPARLTAPRDTIVDNTRQRPSTLSTDTIVV